MPVRAANAARARRARRAGQPRRRACGRGTRRRRRRKRARSRRRRRRAGSRPARSRSHSGRRSRRRTRASSRPRQRGGQGPASGRERRAGPVQSNAFPRAEPRSSSRSLVEPSASARARARVDSVGVDGELGCCAEGRSRAALGDAPRRVRPSASAERVGGAVERVAIQQDVPRRAAGVHARREDLALRSAPSRARGSWCRAPGRSPSPAARASRLTPPCPVNESRESPAGPQAGDPGREVRHPDAVAAGVLEDLHVVERLRFGPAAGPAPPPFSPAG